MGYEHKRQKYSRLKQNTSTLFSANKIWQLIPSNNTKNQNAIILDVDSIMN